MKDCSSASDITDIICLSERVPVGRTPLKQLVTKKACSFKRFPLLQHPVESLLVPVSLIYALFKTQQRFEVQVNKRNLKNVPNTWKEIRQLCRQQRHMIQASDWVVRWNMRRPGLISFSISSIIFLEPVLGGTGRRTGQTRGRNVGPAWIQMCLLRQSAPRTKSMLETQRNLGQHFPFSLSYFRDLAICLTLA